MHGPTFMANPLACSVALASLELLGSEDSPARVAEIESGLRTELEGLSEQEGVIDVRVLGAIGVLEMEHPVDMASASSLVWAFYLLRGADEPL